MNKKKEKKNKEKRMVKEKLSENEAEYQII